MTDPHRWTRDLICTVCRVSRLSVVEAEGEDTPARSTSIRQRCEALGSPAFRRRLLLRVRREMRRRAPRALTRSPLRLTRKQRKARR